jgi:hypothetical protein
MVAKGYHQEIFIHDITRDIAFSLVSGMTPRSCPYNRVSSVCQPPVSRCSHTDCTGFEGQLSKTYVAQLTGDATTSRSSSLRFPEQLPLSCPHPALAGQFLWGASAFLQAGLTEMSFPNVKRPQLFPKAMRTAVVTPNLWRV